MAYNFKIVKDFGTLSKQKDLELKLRLISWGGNTPRYDLRTWKGNTPLKGMSFTKDDIVSLRAVLDGFASKTVESSSEAEKPLEHAATKRSKVVNALTTLPANDGNYESSLEKATEEELNEAINIMETSGGRHKMRIRKCREKLSAIHGAKILEEFHNGELLKSKTEAKATTKTKADKAATKEKAKVLQFPKKKPEIEKLPETDEKRTFDECKAKLEEERKMFRDSDSQYVIDGLLEACETDQNFRNNVMREDKSYAGAFEYFANMARTGHALKYGNVVYLDNNLALEYAIDYFNKA